MDFIEAREKRREQDNCSQPIKEHRAGSRYFLRSTGHSLPVRGSVPPKQLDRTTRRLYQVVQLIEGVEGSGNNTLPGAESETESVKAGTLAHNPAPGVTMLAKDGSPRAYDLMNLSASGNEPEKYGAFEI